MVGWGRSAMLAGVFVSAGAACATPGPGSTPAFRGIDTAASDWRPRNPSREPARDPLPTLREVVAWFAGATGRPIRLGRALDGSNLALEVPARRVGGVACVDVPWLQALEIVVATTGCAVREENGAWVVYEVEKPKLEPLRVRHVSAGSPAPNEHLLTEIVAMLQARHNVSIELGKSADGTPIAEMWPPLTVSFVDPPSVPVDTVIHRVANAAGCNAEWNGERWLLTHRGR